MKALLPGEGCAKLAEIPKPELNTPNDLLLKVLCAGICKTDIWVSKGIISSHPEQPLGHEFCGEVVQKAEQVQGFELGQRVAINPIIPCFQCDDCAAGKPYLCASFSMMGVDVAGAFAEYVCVAAKQCYQVKGLSPPLIAYAEPLAAALSIRQFDFSHQGRVAVIGDDRISQLHRYILETLDIATVKASVASPVDVLVLTSSEHCPLNQVKAGGTIILKGRSPYPWHLNLMAAVKRRLKIVALNYAPFEEAITFLQQHAKALETFLGASYPLTQFHQAFCAAAHKKVFLTPCVD